MAIMQQIKIFKGLESDIPALEKAVNTWLADSRVRVIQMFGNIAPQSQAPEDKQTTLHRGAHAPSDVIMVVLYEVS
jgi:hypothetical protein